MGKLIISVSENENILFHVHLHSVLIM